jgi:hypothetical protein
MSRRNHKKKQARVWHLRKNVQPTPSRAEDQPFCAYFGPKGEKCTNTTEVQPVLTLKGFATLMWMACPQHRAEVHKLALNFVQRCQLQPHMLAFDCDDTILQVRVALHKKLAADS